jgi:hypothetical protein
MPAPDALKRAFAEHDIPWPTQEQFKQAQRAADEHDRAKEAAQEVIANDGHALWALADLYAPPDIREWATRHKMPELTTEIWRSAFCAGWRAAMRAKPV